MNHDFEQLKKSKETREAFVNAHVRNGIAFQLRRMRLHRGLDQKGVAALLGNEKLQPVISRYENPDYGKFSVSTLLEIANAYDVALIVRFGSFGELVEWDRSLSPQKINVLSFKEECKMREAAESSTWTHITSNTVSYYGGGFHISPPPLVDTVTSEQTFMPKTIFRNQESSSQVRL